MEIKIYFVSLTVKLEFVMMAHIIALDLEKSV